MHDPQPPLPFGESNTLEEIRRLLVTQNELLRTLVERLADPTAAPVFAAVDPMVETDIYSDLGQDELTDELLDDEEFWEEAFDDDELLPDPPMWFAQHYPFE